MSLVSFMDNTHIGESLALGGLVQCDAPTRSGGI